MPSHPPLRGSTRLTRAIGFLVVLLAAMLPPGHAHAAPLRVLFVGNSYTYTNDLPALFAAVASARGQTIEVGELTAANAAIEDHIVSGDLARRLSEGWDWVILQQGPSSQPDSRLHLRHWAAEAARQAREAGAQAVLMSVWPALQNAHTWRDAELSYRLAAADAQSCVLPVATAWRLARERAPGIALYLPDRLHPTPDGSLLAALLIERGLRAGPLRPHAPRLLGQLPDKRWRIEQQRIEQLDALAVEALAGEPGRCHHEK